MSKFKPPIADGTLSEPSDTDATIFAQAHKATQQKNAQTHAVVEAMPYNLHKASEHGLANALSPERGDTVKPDSRLVTGSTLTEEKGSEKNRQQRTGWPQRNHRDA